MAPGFGAAARPLALWEWRDPMESGRGLPHSKGFARIRWPRRCFGDAPAERSGDCALECGSPLPLLRSDTSASEARLGASWNYHHLAAGKRALRSAAFPGCGL